MYESLPRLHNQYLFLFFLKQMLICINFSSHKYCICTCLTVEKKNNYFINSIIVRKLN